MNNNKRFHLIKIIEEMNERIEYYKEKGMLDMLWKSMEQREAAKKKLGMTYIDMTIEI